MIKHRTSRRAFGLTAVAVSAALLLPAAAAAQADPTTPGDDESLVNILYFNDFHGRLDSYENLTVGFAAKLEELRAENGEENSVVIAGGDSVGGTLYTSSSQNDDPTISVLNALEIDASALGNHEFDKGIDDLENRILPGVDFPYLGANVTHDGAPVGEDGGVTLVDVGGVTVGIIGAVTQQTPGLVDQAGIEGVEFGDPVAAVNEQASALKESGTADVIIATYHEGATVELPANAEQDAQAAALQTAMSEQQAFDSIVNETSADVDVIVNGHTHKMYNWMAPVPGSDELRPVLQAGEYAANIGQIPLLVNNTTGEVSVDTANFQLHPTKGAVIPEGNDRVDQVAQIVADAEAEAEILGGEVIGSIEGDITTAFQGEVRDDRGNASAMGTLVANMYRDATAEQGGAEIGIVNPGGLRADLYEETNAGELTVRQAVDVLPFANNLFTGDFTGAQLKAVLEEQWQPAEASRPYLQLGLSDNVQYTSDSSREQGDRITGIWLEGELVTDEQVIRVALPSFLTSGTGDNFFTLGDGANVMDSGIVDSDAFQQYFKDNQPLTPDYSRTQLDLVGLNPVGTLEVAVGDTIAFDVNKVNLTSIGAPVSEEITVLFGDDELTFPVEANSAAVSFEVPNVAVDGMQIRAGGVLVDVAVAVSGVSDEPTDPSDPTDPTDSDDPTTPTDDDATGDDDLPETGFEISGVLLALAAVVLIGGGALTLRTRRS
ncbi:MAG: bifunctional metallophosphatase/5'-nucleotidase [Agrococcus casei]|uniref:bifunctional metallophosphatase/5'-nucleotidase n=1 Tax=Agrococcus casei TaxID=343512 RepID=UPI003F98D6C1